jgi:argonaute-like protein implicated in RNA metabolism and viral defense
MKQKSIDREIRDIGNKLPFGAKNEIAKVTGISNQTVNKFFQGHKVRPKFATKILNAAIKHIDEAIEVEKGVQELSNKLNQNKAL